MVIQIGVSDRSVGLVEEMIIIRSVVPILIVVVMELLQQVVL